MRSGGIGRVWESGHVALGDVRCGRRFLVGPLNLVLVEPAFEEGDGGAEVIVEGDEQVDVVEILLAAEAVRSEERRVGKECRL